MRNGLLEKEIKLHNANVKFFVKVYNSGLYEINFSLFLYLHGEERMHVLKINKYKNNDLNFFVDVTV